MANLGDGAGSGYPAAVDTKQTYVNGPNPITDSNSRIDSEVLNDALDALVKVETELGVNPSGSEATVTARLAKAFRTLYGNWEQQNVVVSQAAVALKLNADNAELVLPYSGSVLAISVASTEARTAGTLTVEVTINGVATGLTAVLNATNTQFKHTTQASGLDTFNAGDRLGVKITTDASWAPTTADIIVNVVVELTG